MQSEDGSDVEQQEQYIYEVILDEDELTRRLGTTIDEADDDEESEEAGDLEDCTVKKDVEDSTESLISLNDDWEN